MNEAMESYGKLAHEAFMKSQGLKWSEGAWRRLDKRTREAWIAAADAVMGTHSAAVLA